jgi:hypothetical protein
MRDEEYAQQEIQEQPFHDSSQFIPQRNKMDGEFIRSLYETGDVLNDIESFLKGRTRDNDGNWVQSYNPIMKQEGVNLLMGDLRMHLTKIHFLSNKSRKDVNRVCKEMRKMIISWLYLNWQTYEIDKSNLTRIVMNIDHAIFSAEMKSLDDKERMHLFPTTTRSENVMVQEEPKKRFGIF